jgi:NADH-quinone oxidoreductase subunit J
VIATTYVLYVLLALIVVLALWTIQTTILPAAVGLALVSVILTLLMFQMQAPLAAVFELSVCAGLITVVFVSTIALTRPLNAVEAQALEAVRNRRFRPAILVVAAVGGLLWVSGQALQVIPPAAEGAADTVRQVLWTARRLDLLGQIVMIFVGVYGVVVLFKKALAQKEIGR